MNNLAITHHANVRFFQRFKLKIHKDMRNKSGIRHMINIMFNKSIRCDLRLRNQIGLYNSICIKYNGKVEYYLYDNIIFACVRKKNELVLNTVFNNRNFK